MKLAYRIVNVFARAGEPFTGNPLCVFEDGSELSDAGMQALALQFNLSETTFILPSDKASARVRIFTPSMELPFAGHPTLGTAQVVRALTESGNNITLEMQAGVIPVSAEGNRWTLQANAPKTRPFDASRSAELAAALGLDVPSFAAAPLWVNTGMEQLLVPLASKDAVSRVSPGAALAGFANISGKVSVYCFSPLADEKMLVRFFFAKNAGSVAEDPATGSACANLGGYAVATGLALPLKRTLRQGDQVGRPSVLGLAVDAARTIRVSGEVIELGRGTLEL
jgi:PhzF family phenazine biosynthesis protein